MNLRACTTKATLQLVKMHTNSVTLHPWETLEYPKQFQHIPHNIFTTYNSFSLFLEKRLIFSTETHGNAIFPHKVSKTITVEIKKELVRLSDVIFKDQPMTILILGSSTINSFHRLMNI